MATNKDLKRWYTGEGNSPKDFVRLNEEGKVDDDLIPGSGGSEGVIIEASANKTVNNYQVPQLTDEQLLQIYNAVVAGKPVTVTDATGSMHFSSLNADSVSGEIFVTMLYFDKMILEYAEGDQTTFTEIGGGGDKLYLHHLGLYDSNYTIGIRLSWYSRVATPQIQALSDVRSLISKYGSAKSSLMAPGSYTRATSSSWYPALPRFDLTSDALFNFQYQSSFGAEPTAKSVSNSATFTETVIEI